MVTTADEVAGFALSPVQEQVLRDAAVRPPCWVQCRVAADRMDPALLREGLRTCVERHEVLRTVVGGIGQGQSRQVVGSGTGIELRVWDGATGSDETDELVAAERAPFELSQGPLLRALLLRPDAGPATLVLTASSLVADRESLRLIGEEVLAHPGDGIGGDDPDGPLQYADFAGWHLDLLTEAGGEPDRAWWRARLAEAGQVGGDLPSPGGGARRRHEVRLPVEVVAGLRQVAGRAGVEPAVLQETAVRLALGGLLGCNAPLAASVGTGRTDLATHRAVGPFARELPLVLRIRPEERVVAAAVRLQGLLNAARERIDHLDPAWRRGPGVVGREPPVVEHVERVTTQPGPASTQDRGATGALEIATVGFGAEVTLTADHDVDAVDARGVARLLDRCVDVLRAVAADPAVTVRTALRPSAQELAELLEMGGVGRPQPAAEPPLWELVAARARVTPDRPAVTCGPHTVTYGSLVASANRLARRLSALGVRRGDRVAVSMRRGAALPGVLLAVARSGAAFVPVDAAAPRRRLAVAVADAAALIVDDGERSGAAVGRPVVVIEADGGFSGPAAGTRHDLPAVRGADDAYVMYTSGSTGAPNGVVVSHAALSNYLCWAAAAYRLTEGSGALVHSSIGFDLTLTGLLAPLTAGQRVVLVPDAAGLSGLATALRVGRDLSLLKLTPTHLDMLGQLLTPEEVRGSVRTLVVGGEQLHADSAALFAASGTRVVNEYGPTETVVGATWHELDRPGVGPVPIGVPAAAAEIVLLDSAGDLVGRGAVGEICIGGPGVARGYARRPGSTAERFVADPRGSGRTLYRSGDLGRWSDRDLLQYLGRTDDQIKIRGVRVEPGEIEHALGEHPAVGRPVVVVLQDRRPGWSSPVADRRLVAYVTTRAGHPAPSEVDLTAHCREVLSEALVPSAVVVLAGLPMTASGKVDRSALPAPDAHRRAAIAATAPRTRVETIIHDAMADVLGLERAGIDESYFALGGDSIRSVMIVSRVQAQGVHLTVEDLHRLATVRELAAHAERAAAIEPGPPAEPFSLVEDADQRLLPGDVEDAFPLSLLQEGMIFHRDFAAKSAVYHALSSVRLKAPLDLTAMRLVIQQLVARHPMLRTSFDMASYSRPLQLVHTGVATPLDSADLRGLPAAEQDTRIEEWIAAEKALGFELHEYPLIRFMVHVLGEDTWQFTYGFHHEIVDGWSEALMVTELFGHYFSLIFDEPTSIRTPTSTMRDAVALELAALDNRADYRFWEDYLADATSMRLPRTAEGPHADKGDRAIVRLVVPVDAELSERLKALARDSAVPLKNVLMAAHMAVMSAYGGNVDTITYTVTNGRPETDDGSTAVGLFVNSLAIRLRMSGGTWRDLIAAGLEAERSTLPHRRLPMAELKRHQGNEPISECLFFFTDYHVYAVLDRWTRRGVEHMATDLYGESTFPFCAIFRLDRESRDLEVRLEYDSLQFTAELMDDVCASYVSALHALVDEPDAHYERHDLRSPADRDRSGVRRAGPPVPGPRPSLHGLVEQRAAQTPDAIALQAGTSTVSYGALNRRAARLAGRLGPDVGVERVVGVLAPRGIAQIVGVLAVLKAGATYLPLDPAQPDARLRTVLAAGSVEHVLVTAELAARLADGVRAVPIDAAGDAPAATACTAPSVDPAGAAYLMYTSGSSGEPTGVVVEHRNAVASLQARSIGYPDAPERFLLLSSFAFDSSVAGIFWTLAGGGTLILPRDGAELEPAELVETVERQRPTHTLAIPSLLSQILEQAGPTALRSLRVVVAAGESCPPDLARGLPDRLPDCRFVNEYGPTEASVWSTAWHAPLPPHRALVPIGRPVAGATVEVTDMFGKPVPTGVPGELRIGGTGVSRGYHGDPARTASRFRPDPWSQRPGARCYLSGDLGRYLPDGNLEFLGRSDHQVKIRGFRVELGEIEAVLAGHPGLQRSIVLARTGSDGDQHLVAYSLPRPGVRPSRANLRTYVRDRLPRYMVPSACVVLDAVPLTPTGKIDRGALPAPRAEDMVGPDGHREPTTDTEKLLCEIWASVLDLDAVGVHYHFFEIGGESLRAMQATTAANKVFGVRMSVRSLFDAPTVAELAPMVDRERFAATVPDEGRRQ